MPARARLYEVLTAAYPDWLSRDEAAQRAAVSRSLAAFHLDKLAEASLLDVSSRRLGNRRGPGAGRPSKLYRRSVTGLEISLPPRDYELAAELLVRAVEAGGSRRALAEAARAAGGELPPGDVPARLARLGYQPVQAADGSIRLRNCPFHALAERHRDVVCAMNHALVEGLLEDAAGDGYVAELQPQPGFCCVVLRPDAAE